MQLLSVHNLTFTWGYKPLINNLSFSLNRGQTIGIAGPNGGGKSSLVKLLTGGLGPDSGEIAICAGSKVAVVAQQAEFGSTITVADYLLADIHGILGNLAAVETRMSESPEAGQLAALLAEYGRLQEAAAQAGAYQARDMAAQLLQQTGLPFRLEQSLSTLSGGEASVLSILKALVGDPDILILDEPGNHLDYLGLAWLERLLGEQDKAIVLVSHNRFLLDQSADFILYLEAGRHYLHRGNYSQFRHRRAQQLAEEEKAWAARERELHSLNCILKDLLHRASLSCNPPPKVMIDLGNTKKKIAALRLIHDQGRTPQAKTIKLKLRQQEHKGQTALSVTGLSLSYGPRLVLDNISFQLKRGERLALVGSNGCGKTSLVRQIQNAGDHGPVRLSPSVKLGFVTQQSPFGHPERSLADEVRDWGPLSLDSAYKLVAPFAFAWNELEKPIGTLSGGELQRLQLARLSYAQVNCLILDEPSNHLDIPSRELLEDCLDGFEGSMLIVSHDRYLLDRLATRILHLRDGRLSEFEGNFSGFLASQAFSGSRHDRVKPGATPIREAPAGPSQSATDLEQRINHLESEIRELCAKIAVLMGTDPGLAGRLEPGLAKKRAEADRLYREILGD